MNKAQKYLDQASPIQKDLLAIFDENAPLNVLDIGSCEGLDAIRYQRMFKQANIYAFEPLPSNYQKIRDNLIKYNAEKIKVFPVALSDTIGKSTFYVSSGQPQGAKDNLDWDYGNKSSSLLAPDLHTKIYDWCKFEEKIEVDSTTLDSFLVGKGLTSIDLIHMDVQGAELKVLQGAQKTLSKVNLIWTEVGNLSLYKGQPLKQEVHQYLRSHGFMLAKELNAGSFADHLYVKKRFLKRKSWMRYLQCQVDMVKYKLRTQRHTTFLL